MPTVREQVRDIYQRFLELDQRLLREQTFLTPTETANFTLRPVQSVRRATQQLYREGALERQFSETRSRYEYSIRPGPAAALAPRRPEPEPTFEVTEEIRPRRFSRYSYGIKWTESIEELKAVVGPIHDRYYGALIQAWSYDERLLESRRLRLKDRLRSQLERFIRNLSGDPYWSETLKYQLVDDGEGTQEEPYDVSLADRWESRIESETGEAEETDNGNLRDA